MRDDRGGNLVGADAPVAGILLAAGASVRMGTNKLLLPLLGETVVRRAARHCLAAGLDPVLAVVGHERERVARELAGLSAAVVIVSNPDFARGVNTSLSAGIAAVPERAGAAVVVLADMPLVSAEMIAALVARYRESRASLVISDYAGVAAPPTLYARALFGELQGGHGEGGGRRVVLRHRSQAEAMSWPAELLADLDSPGDVDAVERMLAARGPSRAATR